MWRVNKSNPQYPHTTALVQGDTSKWYKPPIDIDLGSSVILPGHTVATIASHQLQELLEQSQREVFTIPFAYLFPALLFCEADGDDLAIAVVGVGANLVVKVLGEGGGVLLLGVEIDHLCSVI